MSNKNKGESLNTNINNSITKTESKEVICKDGFCYLPSKGENTLINKKGNIFDPI